MSCRQNSIAAKRNIFLSFGLKVPFDFPCFARVCLERFCHLRVIAFSSRAKHMLQILEVLQAVL